jgi:hypothetical protein
MTPLLATPFVELVLTPPNPTLQLLRRMLKLIPSPLSKFDTNYTRKCSFCVEINSVNSRINLGGVVSPCSCKDLINSPSRTRTYNLAVNSRSLYQLSYRGNCTNWPRPISQTLKAIHVQISFRHYPNFNKFVKMHLFFTANITKKRNCAGQIADYCVK